MRWLRVVWGLALLLRPDAVLSAAGATADPRTVLVARVLGVRHLAQSAAIGPGAAPVVRQLAAAGDVLHVGTCVLAAVALPGHRRAAVADGVVESVLAATGVASVVRRRNG